MSAIRVKATDNKTYLIPTRSIAFIEGFTGYEDDAEEIPTIVVNTPHTPSRISVKVPFDRLQALLSSAYAFGGVAFFQEDGSIMIERGDGAIK